MRNGIRGSGVAWVLHEGHCHSATGTNLASSAERLGFHPCVQCKALPLHVHVTGTQLQQNMHEALTWNVPHSCWSRTCNLSRARQDMSCTGTQQGGLHPEQFSDICPA